MVCVLVFANQAVIARLTSIMRKIMPTALSPPVSPYKATGSLPGVSAVIIKNAAARSETARDDL
ncbi:hypothetical protein D3C76_1460380 [compost metagenome]